MYIIRLNNLVSMIDMTERYAELTLYVGFVPRSCARRLEGRLVRDIEDKAKDAMQSVQMYFQPGFRSMITLCGDNFVETDAQAEELIAFAKAHIPRAYDVLEPESFAPGQLRFWRKLRIESVGEADAERLVTTLKESGHVPKDEEVERYLLCFGSSLSGTEEETRQQFRERRGINPDRPWYNALRFYDENGNRLGAPSEDDD